MVAPPVDAMREEPRDGWIQVAGIAADGGAEKVVLSQQRIAQPESTSRRLLGDVARQR